MLLHVVVLRKKNERNEIGKCRLISRCDDEPFSCVERHRDGRICVVLDIIIVILENGVRVVVYNVILIRSIHSTLSRRLCHFFNGPRRL